MDRKIFRHRPVLKNDIPAICSFPQNEEELFYCFPKAVYPLTPDQLQAAIDQRSDSTVVEADGVVAGFANFYRWQDGRCSLGNLISAPEARGRGVAEYLVRTMIRLAQVSHGAAITEVACFNRNTNGFLLYRKLGFKPFDIEERRAPDGSRVALIHMRYQLIDPKPEIRTASV